ncbi:HNH endonuclease [Sphingomonas sp. MA1305]|uniref:HNH endonuclease n=1 Tax=Sphingomonas sp. MA1305 TaxID=2479204 RepID=UPI0018DFB5DB|nr:HNH endonuclease signature motif containing protein [Sphingomonas sp. MA1305]MBI0474237.1 HNH endonuclease [Sphingomonas sp. MA1305]
MSLSAEVLDALVATGMTAEQLAVILKADMAAEQAKIARQVPWAKLRQMAFERDGECCGYCGTEAGPFEIDHIVPRAAGGENVLENVIVACQSCNRAKRDRQGEEWRVLSDRRARDRERKRAERAEKKGPSKDVRTVRGQSKDKVDTSPEVSPNDIYSNPLPNPTTGAEAPCPLAERVVEAWNEGPGKRGATTAKPLDAGRRKSLSLRLKEHTEAEVFEAIRNVGASDFHCGKNDRGWTANLGWLLKSPENFQKALELMPRKPLAPPASGAPTDLIQHILRRQAA